MKSLVIASIAAAGMFAAAPVMAQTTTPSLTSPQGYVDLGYTYLNPYKRDLGEVTGRLGLRMGRYWGVEGEIGGGVIGNHFGDGAGNRANLSEGIAAAGYVVGYLPLLNDKLDLLARAGYGETPLQVRSDGGPSGSVGANTIGLASWNYGAGAQYMLDHKNGLRFDYTRRDFQAPGFDNPKDIDTYAVSYVHKF